MTHNAVNWGFMDTNLRKTLLCTLPRRRQDLNTVAKHSLFAGLRSLSQISPLENFHPFLCQTYHITSHTDGQKNVTQLIVAFHKSAKASKKGSRRRVIVIQFMMVNHPLRTDIVQDENIWALPSYHQCAFITCWQHPEFYVLRSSLPEGAGNQER